MIGRLLALMQTKQGLLALLVASTVLLGAGFGFLAPTDDGPPTDGVVSPPSTDDTGVSDDSRTDDVEDDESAESPSGESTSVSTPTPTDSRTDGANDADDRSAANSGGNRGNGGNEGRTLDLRLGLQSGQAILDVENAVPGQTGERVVSVRNAGSLNGRLAASVSVVDQAENDLTDPERRVDDSPDRGELDEWLELRVSVLDDDGDGRTYLLGSADDYVSPADVGDGTETTVSLSSREQRELLVEWCLPTGAGNEIQSDSVRLAFEFFLVQR